MLQMTPSNREDAVNRERDFFVGTWELDPATLDYQFGRPGHRATYVIEAVSQGLMFTLDGEDADRKPMKFTYGGELDGRDQPLPGMDAVLVLTRQDANNIESVLKRGGKVVDRWARELLPDLRAMRIVQHGVKPDGAEFRNTSIYRRVK
jgi:hypothetical protein